MSDCMAGVITALGGKDVKRLYDILHPAPVDNRTPDQIVADITARAGLKVVKHTDERIGPDGDAGA